MDCVLLGAMKFMQCVFESKSKRDSRMCMKIVFWIFNISTDFPFLFLRFSSVSLFGAPHTNHSGDVTIQGKLVPRDTIVMSNYFAMNMNKDVFHNAQQFDPTHFYDAKTNMVVNADQITPFGIGKTRRFLKVQVNNTYLILRCQYSSCSIWNYY